MAALTTYFQVSLPRLRSAWFDTELELHNLVLHGTAGSPWQYRVLSDYLIQALFNLLNAMHNPNPYFYGFVLFRTIQELGIFALGFLYLRKLGLGTVRSIIGLLAIFAATIIGLIETNWRLDDYTEVLLYILAGVLILYRRLAFVVLVTALAALNRETGMLIPLLPIGLLKWHSPGVRTNAAIYRTVGICVAVFAAVRFTLLWIEPGQDLSSRVVTDRLDGTLHVAGAYVYIALALGLVPLLAAIGLPLANSIVRCFFWLIVPVWFVTHWWGSVATTPISFLVPLALVLVPSSLCAASALSTATGPAGAHVRFSEFAWAAKENFARNLESGLAIAAVYVVGPIAAAVMRIVYPFQLDRFEGPMLQEVRRLTLGQQIYVPPGLEYVPTLYGPLYFYLSAGLATLTGVSFTPLRIISLIASIGAACFVYLLASRDARSPLAGVLAACLFLGAADVRAGGLETVRVDALCVLFLTGAIYTARLADFHSSSRSRLSALCGLLVGLALLTKQTASVMALALLVLALPSARSRLLPYAAGLVLPVATAGLYLQFSSDGWARFYLIDLPRNHALDWSLLVGFWTDNLLPYMAIPLVLGAVYLMRRTLQRDSTAWFYLLAGGGMVAISWISVLNTGSAANTLRPAYAALALFFGLGFVECLRLTVPHLHAERWARAALIGVSGLTLVSLVYVPGQTASLRANALAGQRLVDAIANLPGSVWAPELGEFQVAAQKGDQAYPAMWHELLGSYGGVLLPEGREFKNDLDQALSTKRFAYVLLDPDGIDPTLSPMLGQHGYVNAGPLFSKDDVFFNWRLGRARGGGSLTPSPDVYVPGKT